MARADQRKFHYIYKITRTDGSGKYYIGMHSTDDLEDGYFGSGKILWHSINRHGKEVHTKEILEFLPSRQELKVRERELVNEEIVNDPLCMNLKLGGEGGGRFWSEEHQAKFMALGHTSEAAKKRWLVDGYREIIASSVSKNVKCWWMDNPEAGRMKINNLATLHTGRKRSDETREKISVSQAGEKNSQFGTCWVTNGVKPIKIKKEMLDDYLTNGYRRGRK